MTGISINEGKEHLLHKDGTFHVDERTGFVLTKSGDFAQVGITFRTMAQVFECPQCKRENIIKDSCGRCGWSCTT
jgi:hypothetical protein